MGKLISLLTATVILLSIFLIGCTNKIGQSNVDEIKSGVQTQKIEGQDEENIFIANHSSQIARVEKTEKSENKEETKSTTIETTSKQQPKAVPKPTSKPVSTQVVTPESTQTPVETQSDVLDQYKGVRYSGMLYKYVVAGIDGGTNTSYVFIADKATAIYAKGTALYATSTPEKTFTLPMIDLETLVGKRIVAISSRGLILYTGAGETYVDPQGRFTVNRNKVLQIDFAREAKNGEVY